MFFSDGYWMMGMHVFWWLVWIAGLGVLAVLVLGGRAQAGETPRQVLKRRLASGEISPEEYQQRRALLNRS